MHLNMILRKHINLIKNIGKINENEKQIKEPKEDLEKIEEMYKKR